MKKLCFIVLVALPWLANAQMLTYYNAIDFNASPQSIKQQLSDLITYTHTTVLTYTPGVWDALEITDLNPDDTTHQDVLLIYGYNDTDNNAETDRTRDKSLECHTSSCSGLWVREHVFPRSLGTPNLEYENAGSDAHSLRAIDNDMNSKRSNRKFADGSGHANIVSSGYWYPGDEWKGDVARMMMYMFLRYPTQCIANNVAYSHNTYSNEMPDIFLEWNAEDPVSTYELQRNNHLQTLQGNRNPFIDNPYLATLIWGGNAAENTWDIFEVKETMPLSDELSIYPNPTQDYLYYKTTQHLTAVYVLNALGCRVETDEDLTDDRLKMPSKAGVYFVVFESNVNKQTKTVFVK